MEVVVEYEVLYFGLIMMCGQYDCIITLSARVIMALLSFSLF